MLTSTLRTPDQSAARTPDPCQHMPQCPTATAPDHAAARILTSHPEQGWSILCNGVVVFDDLGEILPDGTCVAPWQPSNQRTLLAA